MNVLSHSLPGGFGVDFSSMDDRDVRKDVRTVARRLLKHGVTSFCPTIVSSSEAYYRKVTSSC